jgi:hypothetical protein
VHAGVIDESTGTVYANMIVKNRQNDNNTFMLAFTNKSSKSEVVRCTFESMGTFSHGTEAAFLHMENNILQAVCHEEEIPVTIKAHSTTYCQLLTGSKQYIMNSYRQLSWKELALTKIVHNTINGTVTVQYSLPYATVDKVEFVIVNIMGKTIWHVFDNDHAMAGGDRSFYWNAVNSTGKKIGSGVYILKMTAYQKSKKVGVIDRRITVLP